MFGEDGLCMIYGYIADEYINRYSYNIKYMYIFMSWLRIKLQFFSSWKKRLEKLLELRLGCESYC